MGSTDILTSLVLNGWTATSLIGGMLSLSSQLALAGLYYFHLMEANCPLVTDECTVYREKHYTTMALNC